MTHTAQQPKDNDRTTPGEWQSRIRCSIVIIIVALTFLSRFALLGDRVMSHDEVNHVVPSYELSQGKGYQHNPITHGPFQFHIIALAYFLFGDNDTTSRIPAALFSAGAVLFVMAAFRRYLGRNGALIAGALFLISPFMLFYGRYARNEGFIELIGVVLLYGILRHLETGDRLSMFLVTLATVMHFVMKETAFIYTAQAMIFLFILFLVEARRAMQGRPNVYNRFLLFMALALLLVLLALSAGMIDAGQENTAKAAGETTAVETQPAGEPVADPMHLLIYVQLLAVAGAGIFGLMGLFTLSKTLGWPTIKQIRSFSLLLLIGTLILPMLTPFPISMLGWNPLDYSSSISIVRTGSFILLFFLIAAAIGLWWNPLLWLQNALLFYAIFTVFYTTFFTNPNGLLTGMVGSLGYWLAQQAEERGSQPMYYYLLIQMPIYEFLPCLGTFLATYFAIRRRRFSTLPGDIPAFISPPDPDEALVQTDSDPLSQAISFQEHFYSEPRPQPVLGLLLFWAATSLAAYSLAGERMPWLTVHITMPFLLASGWSLGYLIDTTGWKHIPWRSSLFALLLAPVLLSSIAGAFSSLSGANAPFQGNTLEQIQATARFLLSTIAAGASLGGLFYSIRSWSAGVTLRLATLAAFMGMAVLTARTAYWASFLHDDYAYEYLVYAHAGPAPKEVLRQVEALSRQTSGEKAIRVAYGGGALYPYWWYLRDYPNQRYFGITPTRELRDYSVIIVGNDLFDRMGPIVADEYESFEYIRLWWPNQDYWYLNWDRVWNAISNPQMRAAIFQIWLNRDYRAYAALTDQTAQVSPETWSPAERMRVYIRKDAAGSIWSAGLATTARKVENADPYAARMSDQKPAQIIGTAGSQPGQFQAPRGLKVAPDGSLYAADSRNHRIQHLAPDGTVLQVWGSFADVSSAEAPGGTFNEPWDIAIGKDGSVYVADTWNHRVQKFTADGSFIKMWGSFGQGEQPDAFWGPRGLAVDSQGRVFVVDTGNKRVVVFNPDGTYVMQFGSAGLLPGQMDEPVGIAIDAKENVYITDTWNQRVQVFSPSGPGNTSYQFDRAWDIAGWDGQSLENKPFIAINPINGYILVTDPEGPRVLEFNENGTFLRGWGDFSTDPTQGFGLTSGIAVDHNGSIWLSDAGNQVLLRFP